MSASLARTWGAQKPPLGSPISPGHPLAQGLVGCWLLNEGAGASVMSAAGNANGTVSGAASWGAGGLFFPSPTTSAYASVAVPLFNAPPVSFVLLVKPAVIANYSAMIGSPATTHGALLFSGAGGNPLGYLWEGSADEYAAPSGLFLTTGRQSLCALVITSTQATLYAPSAPGLKSWTNTKAHSTYSVSSLLLGSDRRTGDHYWAGSISAAFVYNRALSAAEVASLYAQPYQMFARGVQRFYSIPKSLLLAERRRLLL